jgi:hypothetical protein
VLKGAGTGLRGSPREVVSLPPGRATGHIGDWQLRTVDVPAGWVASVALLPDRSAAGQVAPLTGVR